jgi:integrase
VHLYKRGKVWWLAISRTERVSTRCKTREAADIWARRREREDADPDRAAKEAATLSDALDLVIRDAESKASASPPKGSPATVDFYRRKAGVIMSVLAPRDKDRDNDLPLRAVDAACVDGYITTRRADGVVEGTINKELITWRSAMKRAKRAGLWSGDIAEVFPIAFAPEYKPKERWVTYGEWLKLLADAEALDQPESRREDTRAARMGILAGVAFMIATSAEWGAFERARPEDVDLVRFRVHVRGTKDAQKGGNRDRVIPIVHLGHALLLAFAMEHADGSLMLFRERGNFRRDLASMCERAGIARLSPNDLRRTHAMWLRAGGVPAGQIAPLLGHADGRMVERVYGRIKPVDLEAALTAHLAIASR